MILDWETFLSFVPLLVQGAVTTIELTVLVTIFGFLIALPVALARNSTSAPRAPVREVSSSFSGARPFWPFSSFSITACRRFPHQGQLPVAPDRAANADRRPGAVAQLRRLPG
jgi:ABC-type amino acid transport system permease subunit